MAVVGSLAGQFSGEREASTACTQGLGEDAVFETAEPFSRVCRDGMVD